MIARFGLGSQIFVFCRRVGTNTTTMARALRDLLFEQLAVTFCALFCLERVAIAGMFAVLANDSTGPKLVHWAITRRLTGPLMEKKEDMNEKKEF